MANGEFVGVFKSSTSFTFPTFSKGEFVGRRGARVTRGTWAWGALVLGIVLIDVLREIAYRAIVTKGAK